MYTVDRFSYNNICFLKKVLNTFRFKSMAFTLQNNAGFQYDTSISSHHAQKTPPV